MNFRRPVSAGRSVKELPALSRSAPLAERVGICGSAREFRVRGNNRSHTSPRPSLRKRGEGLWAL
jgi:hypothetical protein